jgi:hypothetical protein
MCDYVEKANEALTGLINELQIVIEKIQAQASAA